MSYTNNQIIQVKDGQHYIFYKTDIVPISETAHQAATMQVDDKLQELTPTTTQSEQGADGADGMEKLNNNFYNIPHVISSSGDDSYIELYDQDLNVVNLIPITSELLYTVAPNEATYIKLNDVTAAPLASYEPSGKMN